MNDRASKGLPGAAGPLPETEDIGNRWPGSPRQGSKRPRVLSSEAAAKLESFALALRRTFPELGTRRGAEAAVRVMRRALLPRKKSGRPPSKAVTLAVRLRHQGKPWREIYRACIPDYPKLDQLARNHEANKLRDAVRVRRYRTNHNAGSSHR